MWKSLRIRLRALLDPGGARTELDDELRFHLEEQERLYRDQGMPPDEARRRARVAFGGVDAAREAHQDATGARWLEESLKDIRYAARTLWRDRALTVAGIMTLALGIGATTAVFSAVNAVLLRQLPFREPDRLVQLWEENPDRGWHKNVVAPANYLDWRDQAQAFDGVAAYTDYQTNVTLVGQGEPRILAATYVAGDFFSILGVVPRLGRFFEPAHTFDNGDRPAVISYRLWQTQFKGDSSIVGSPLSLGGRRAWQIVGVLPEGYAFPSPGTDVFLPLLFDPQNRTQVFFRRAHWLRVVARLRPGVSLGAANASLQSVVKRLQTEYPETNTHMGAGLTPLHEWVVGNTRRPLIVLLAAAGLLLLIACANVGNLLLVHALGRARDVSLRFALGASRSRIVKQALSESLVLSAIGGAFGLGIGWVGARALLAIQPQGLLPVTDITVDWRVLLFATALTAASGILFGLAPAVIGTRQAPAEVLNSGGRTFAGGYVRRWGRYLVVAEVAVAVLLTVGAGLLLRSYRQLSLVPPGFDPTGVLTATLSVPGSRYDSASRVVGFYSTLVERARALPGVELAGAVRQLPVTVNSWSSDFTVRGRPAGQHGTEVLHREVMGDYFRVMRVPVLQGRAFTPEDRIGTTPVVLINDVLARKHFANEDPIGQEITFNRTPDSASVWRTIVGVVGSEHQASLAQPMRAEIFAPIAQDWSRTHTIVIRTARGIDPSSLAPPLRSTVRDLDSLLAIQELRPMTAVHANAMSRERFTSTLVLVFAVSGVVLAIVGIFGVLAQAVQARSREMGIRLALGAQRSQVRWVIVRHGFVLLTVGTVGGLLAAAGVTQVLGTLLYEIRPTDAPTYAAVALLMIGAGLLAAWIPAWRASRANPAETLRAE
jgi:predicted permease